MSTVISKDNLVKLIKEKAKMSRIETVNLIAKAGSGHYSSSFSSSEIFATLYYHVMNVDSQNPKWADRDRFVMGKGHAAVGVYPILQDLGFYDKESMYTYADLGSSFGDHPDMNKIKGIDFSSGSIGHGLSVCVGMALGGRIDKKNYRTFCLLGDGELQEGQVWEAAMSASSFKLGNLVAICDHNKVTVDGVIEEMMNIYPIREKFESFGWNVIDVDGHSVESLIEIFDSLPDSSSDVPTLIIADTVSGKGVSFMEEGYAWHVGNLAPKDVERAIQEIKEMD